MNVIAKLFRHSSIPRIAFTAGLAVFALCSTVSAAPTMSITQLPISPVLTSQLAAQGLTQTQIEDFLKTLAQIAVYDDHTNPTDPERRDDRSIPKLYWAAPFFTPSPTRSVVGAEQFATSALTIIDAVDKTFGAFEFAANEYQRLILYRANVLKRLDDATTALARPGNTTVEIDSLNALIASLNTELADANAQIANLLTEAGAGAAQLPTTLLQSMARSVLLQLSRLGITPNAEERALIGATNPTDVINGLALLRARAGSGQFGLRQVIVESGYTEQQRSVLRRYLELRPDVTTRSLAVERVFARSAAQSLINQDGEFETRSPVMQIRGVNLGSAGACGSTRSCNVVIEYTDVGARSAALIAIPGELNPVLLPVTFAANVRVNEPDFVGSIFCDFVTGWSAQGRADVRDGAIIYDGDLSDGIHYSTIDSGMGGCQFTIQEGSADSAFYHALSDIDKYYTQLHMQRQIDAKAAKDTYEAQIRAELARQQQNSQRRRGGLFGDIFGFIGGPFGGVIGFLVGETRNFYWHTTTLNTSSVDPIHVFQSYNVHNLQATKSFSFDGFPLVCFMTGSGLNGVMKACPDSEFPDADTETGAGNEVCPETDIFGDCIAP